jgi:hypothetical protein
VPRRVIVPADVELGNLGDPMLTYFTARRTAEDESVPVGKVPIAELAEGITASGTAPNQSIFTL